MPSGALQLNQIIGIKTNNYLHWIPAVYYVKVAVSEFKQRKNIYECLWMYPLDQLFRPTAHMWW